MLCGTVPFKASNMQELHDIITSGHFSFPQQVEGLLSPEAKDLIKQMITLSPEERITIPEILSHRWVTSQSFDELFSSDEMGMALSRSDMLPSLEESSSGNIDCVNVDNLFREDPTSSAEEAKLSYSDYVSITQDYATVHINEEALQVLESLGFPQKVVKHGINKGELNHATASYNLLVLS
mmetsp:Transcript_7384/g.5648  ORF Transcript_7384/g.5648 Transcript_7384/m.5648 type:complete len:181 (-) Transcript_7384:30-572(-)